MNRALPYSHGGSLEIAFYSPFNPIKAGCLNRLGAKGGGAYPRKRSESKDILLQYMFNFHSLIFKVQFIEKK